MSPLFVVCAIAPGPVKTHNSTIVSMDLIFSLKRMQDKKSVTHIWATRTLSLSEKPRTSSATVPLPKKRGRDRPAFSACPIKEARTADPEAARHRPGGNPPCGGNNEARTPLLDFGYRRGAAGVGRDRAGCGVVARRNRRWDDRARVRRRKATGECTLRLGTVRQAHGSAFAERPVLTGGMSGRRMSARLFVATVLNLHID
jgi:hypothetical protein